MCPVAPHELTAGVGRARLSGRKGIINGDQGAGRVGVPGEVPKTFGRRRDAVEIDNAFQRALPVVISKVEQLVFDDCAGNSSAKLAAAQGRLLHAGADPGKVVSRVHSAVAQVGEHLSMQAV